MKPKRLKDCRTKAEEIRWRKEQYRMLNKSWRALWSDYDDLNAKFCGLERELRSLQVRQQMKEATPAVLRDKLAVMRWHYKDAVKKLKRKGIGINHNIPEEILHDDTNRDKRKPTQRANAMTVH